VRHHIPSESAFSANSVSSCTYACTLCILVQRRNTKVDHNFNTSENNRVCLFYFLSQITRRSVYYSAQLNIPIHPLPPFLPLVIPKLYLLPLIPNHIHIHLLPVLFPSIPARLAHQTNQRLFFTPPLLCRYVGQICGAVSPVIMCEVDAQAVRTNDPV
jgi:hypothetical protein